jgi:hypothetical protein
MPSSTEPTAPGQSTHVAPIRAGFEHWNRKLHFYVGLFLLFFTWLFAFSGLILNHPSWTFTEFWNNRKQTTYEREIAAPVLEVKGDLGQAREIMRQLALRGEILWTTIRTDPNQFDFQVRRPGHFFFIKADLARRRVAVQQSDVNLWGVLRALHTFTGVQMDDPRNRRDWALTSLWAYSMDAVAAGLTFMVLSSIYMWFKLPQKRLPGAVVLGLGLLSCGLFCVGLRWLF